MSESNEDRPSIADQTSTIYFNCTQCGKSMSIESAGEGCSVPCPDCGGTVEVPPAHAAPELMSRRLGELSEKLAEVQRIHAAERATFDKIAKELEFMQAAFDRIVLQIEEGRAPDRSARG